MNNLILEIKDFGPINEAKININKINVVGGINASGKSTASKLLYCFLKAMSSNRNEYILESILPDINMIINRMANPMGKNNVSKYNYTIYDDLDKILIDFDRARKIFQSVDFHEEGIGETIDEIEKYLLIIISEKNHSYSPVVKTLFENESLFDFKGDATIFADSFKSSVVYNPVADGLFDGWHRFDLNEKNIQYDDYDKNHIYLTEGDFDYISDVFYIDSVSIFDLDYYINTKDSIKRIFKYKEHLGYLLRQLRADNSKVELSKEVKDKINEVYEKTIDIIGGETYYSPLFKINDFHEDAFYFKPKNDNQLRVNISSGIQQIAVVQTLLHNNKLQPGTFLIIDEPEVNLHPEWQIKFAQVLILLAKELDINLYLNSHSPMFIEAISLYSEYYDLIEEVNIYLTQKAKQGKYVFKKISPKDMGSVYENLTSPYDELDKIKAKILFKE